MTEDAIEKPPVADQRLTDLEARVTTLEKAIAKAFGKYWLEEQGEKE